MISRYDGTAINDYNSTLIYDYDGTATNVYDKNSTTNYDDSNYYYAYYCRPSTIDDLDFIIPEHDYGFNYKFKYPNINFNSTYIKIKFNTKSLFSKSGYLPKRIRNKFKNK